VENNPTIIMLDQLVRVLLQTALTDCVHFVFFLVALAVVYVVLNRA